MSFKKSTRSSGNLGEKYAILLLQKAGYKILQTNFRSKLGEIDIIAIQDGVLVFVEVKTRWSKKYGKPQEAVTPRKLSKIRRIGEYYCLIHPNVPKKVRIDVVAIEVEDGKVSSAKVIKVI